MNPIGVANTRPVAQPSSERAVTVDDERESVGPVARSYRPIRPASDDAAAMQRPEPTVTPTPATPQPQIAQQTPAVMTTSGPVKRKFASSDNPLQDALANSASVLKAVVDAAVLQAQVEKDQDTWAQELKRKEIEQDVKDREEARKNMQLERELRRKRAKFDAQLELYKTDMALYGQGVLMIRPSAPVYDDSVVEE
jgi:hypothetical protein